MNVFDLRDQLVEDYRDYTRSFIKIKDPRIKEFVDGHLGAEGFWPEPLLQLNPAFEPGGTIDDLVAEGVLADECSRIFRYRESLEDHRGRQLLLHRHQREAILKAHQGQHYVLTTGTGSGKSLAYIVPIVDRVLRNGSGRGVQAIIVYPMNALANSQQEELAKFVDAAYPGGEAPVRFARYTGQEGGQARETLRSAPPDVLLTNYMMLELMLTRREDREMVRAAQGLRFLVFDELHTYRGRQGADVAMLMRRCRHAFGNDVICVGTSATMASDGTTEDRRRAVAEVSQALFGVGFAPDQVIGETLQRATPAVEPDDGSVRAGIRNAVAGDQHPPADYDRFRRHPLTSWIESTFGIRKEAETGELLRQAPRRIQGDDFDGRPSAATELAQLTGAEPAQCAETLRRWLLKGSTLRKDPSSRFPIFAFRLHQFLTRGDTVWASLESEQRRHLEISKKAAKPGEPDKPLYPLRFCRHCGTAYYRVRIEQDEHGRIALPRDDTGEHDGDGGQDGYLYVSEESPWPRSGDPTFLDRLPDSFKETTARHGERVRPDARKDVPDSVFVNPAGRIVADGSGIPAALIRDPFLFCLEPSCGVAYTRTQRSERFKLATLGVDNRSTATTILAVRSLIQLQTDRSLDAEARKLLSFTDNRQDASLQAGHFNDFVQVALLRSALHHACARGPATGLRHGDLARCVLDAMELPFADYAADPEVRGPARQTTRDALSRVLEYLLYRDLERGWRVTAPNLEDCGLLRFDYEGLAGEDGLLGDDELWESGFADHEVPSALRGAPAELREQFVRILLDLLRRQLAVKVDVLDPSKQHDLVQQTRPRLLDGTTWYLDDEKELTKAVVAWPRSRRRGERFGLFVSSYGAYGQYLRRELASHLAPNQRIGRPETDHIIHYLFLVLKLYGIVEQVRGERGNDGPGYQLNADALRWLPGAGENRPLDRIRLADEGESPLEVNRYFVECYRHFVDLKCVLEAREHTAQVTTEDRQERERRFREGKLPLLFCSPTMELGVDIKQLNLVNLRNVPPTPANYAQRSGRGGRSGQPALVFTYCAGRSPHDQYFYREPARMVTGTVTPPRVDLRNRDLIRAHIHAIWMETAKPDLGKTLTTVLDLNPDDGRLPLPVTPALREELRDPYRREEARHRAAPLLAEIRSELARTTWFHDEWVEDVLAQIELNFDKACERWRNLYRAAVRQRKLHHDIIGDHSRPEAERNHSRRLRAQAEAQIRLLTEAEGIYEGDFYSYRYFATEGFLPGYNFPRLPVSAFVPGRRGSRGRDEFISRPRFLAVSEFGPRALIYHEGARYRVYKANLDFGSDAVEDARDLTTDTMKRCPGCGYAHFEAGAANLSEVCDRCGAALDVRIDGLVAMQNVTVREAQRITCDEEERQRFGYRLVTAYRFPETNGQLDRKDAEVYRGDARILELSYGDATDLYRVNLGWANQAASQPPGFKLDLERGYWARNQADAGDQDDATTVTQMRRVVPYVRDTKNVLLMRFDQPRSGPEMAGLQAAFKQAIQLQFQIEPRELACEALPEAHDRREILFYEAAEGGAGVLRRVAEDASVLPALARRALEICHYDPESLEDQAADQCGKACYQCLLDYGNQPDHRDLDRALIRDLLAELAGAECRPAGGAGSRAGRLQALRERCDSQLEQRWLDCVDKLGVRLPSDAQYDLPGYFTRPDFFYRDANAAIYIDGPPHDTAHQIHHDKGTTQALIELGYIVIRFHHNDDWEAIFGRHSDVFGAPSA